MSFELLGITSVASHSYVQASALALDAVPPAVIGVGTTLGALALVVHKRKQEIARQGASAAEQEAFVRPMRPAAAQAETPARHEAAQVHRKHVSFAPLQRDLWTPFNKVLLALMLVGALSFLLRFALGLGGSTNLSDTHAWGLWIVFDLVWIAIAAGAFATAGRIYLFGRKDLYLLGRSAVLMGLLSYSFVTVTLIAEFAVVAVGVCHFRGPGHKVPPA